MKRLVLLALSGLLIGCQTQPESELDGEQNEFEFMQVLEESDSTKKVRVFTLSLTDVETKELRVPLKGFSLDYIGGGDTFASSCETGECPTYSISEKIKLNLVNEYKNIDENTLNYLLCDAYPRYIEKYVTDDGFQYNLDWSYLPKDSNKRVSFEWTPGIGVEKEYYSIEVRSRNSIKRCKLDIYYEDIEFSKGLKKDKIRDNCKIDGTGHYITEFYVPDDTYCDLFRYETYEEYEGMYNQYDAIMFETK